MALVNGGSMSLIQRVDWALDMTLWLMCALSVAMGIYFFAVALKGWMRSRPRYRRRHWGHLEQHRSYWAGSRRYPQDDCE